MDMEAIDKVINVKGQVSRMEKELAALQAQLKDIPTWTRLSSTDPYLSKIKIEWDPEVQQRRAEEDEARRQQPAVPETIDLIETPEAQEESNAPGDTKEGSASKYRQKYRALKQSHKELKQIVKNLSTRLEEAEAERDAAIEAASSVKQSPVDAEISTRITEWLQTPHEHPNNRPALASMQPVLRDAKFTNPQKALERYGSTAGILHFTRPQIIFGDSDVNRGLVILPTHRFFPEGHRMGTDKCRWESGNPFLNTGEVRDLFLRREDFTWVYLGAYKCTFDEIVDFEAVKDLHHSARQYPVIRTTVMHRNLVPPVVENVIEAMISGGILKVQCFGLECVGFSEQLDQALHDKSAFREPDTSNTQKGHKRKHSG